MSRVVLNDGICLPVLLVFLALATGSVASADTASLIARLPMREIGVGVAVGIVLALVGSFSLKFRGSRRWITGAWVQIPVVALAMFCFAVSQWLEGSGFIGAFVGGLVFGGLTKQHKEEVLNGAEGTGNVLSLLTWFSFGAVFLGKRFEYFNWRVIVYAILSLTIVRMLPVFLCLTGVTLRTDTKLFLGWFGPRGLASIVFIVMVIHEKLPGSYTLIGVVAWTVVLSIIAHGLSAEPLAKRYGKLVTNRNGVV